MGRNLLCSYAQEGKYDHLVIAVSGGSQLVRGESLDKEFGYNIRGCCL